MDFQKVNPGQPFGVSAATWNAMLDATLAVRGGGRPARERTGGPVADGVITCLVQNVHSSGFDWFSAVAIGDPVILPTDNLLSFQTADAMKINMPTAADVGKWCVLQSSIPASGFGTALFAGVTPCQINVLDVTDTAVDVVDGSTVPASGSSGAGQIIWVAGGVGTATATGVQWAMIRIGGGSSSVPVGKYAYTQLTIPADNAKPVWDFDRAHGI